MKTILIFCILLTFIVCQTFPNRVEDIKKKKKEFEQNLADCILKSEEASSEFKKRIKENKEEDLRNVFHPKDYKLEQNDMEVLRECRKEFFELLREKRREKYGKIIN